MQEVDRQYHEVANIFPLMQGEEYEGLRADIKANGLLEPVWLHPDNNFIIDGRNRHRACVDLGVKPAFRYWTGDGSLVSFVVSLNLKRRHLNESQRAMVAAKIANMGKGNPTGANQHTGGNAQICAFPETLFPVEASPNGVTAISQDEAAKLLNVGKRSVQSADAVQDHGTPELIAAVERGEVAVSTASVISQAPPEDQIAILAKGPKQIVEASNKIRAKKTEKRRAERKARNEEKCAEPTPLVDLPSRFDLVYADPPWRYDFNQTDSRVIENQYPTMALEDICAMPLGDITIDNCVLFLWATFPKLEEAIQVVNAWGFKYRTAIVWDKVRMGQGVYTRQQTELLLIAIKGEMYSPERDYAGNFRSLVSIERSQNHSEKPKEFYGIIEGLYPDCTKVELFARNRRDGWFSWGNQA